MAYGSVEHPVVLDPFRTIVEVHWNTVTHIAFTVTVQARTIRVADSEPCSPAVVGPPVPAGYDSQYLSGLRYFYPSSPVSSIHKRTKDVWTQDSVGVEVSGLPAGLPEFTYGAWQHRSEHFSGTVEDTIDPGPPIVILAERNRAGVFRPDTGSDTEIEVPGRTEKFQTDFSPAFSVYGNDYSSPSPVCATDGFAISTVRAFGTTAIYIEPFTIELGTVVATYQGRNHPAIAARVIPLPTPDGIDTARVLWVLCEREASTTT